MATTFVFWDIGVVIIAATLLALVSRMLRQPLILAYVLAGILIGPLGMGLIRDTNLIISLAELGIAFLLFIVGLELDLRRLKDVGLFSSTGAVIQSIMLFCLGFLIASMLGFSKIDSVYLGLIVSFSSTMLVIKFLSDRNELETLHGRIALGVLLTEDVLVIVALSILTTLDGISVLTLSEALIKGIGFISIAIVASRFVIPTLFRFISRSHELLFLTSLSICFIFAGLSDMIGFSIAIGAFVAGVSVAAFPYNLEIVGRVRSLRDFFVTIFFVSLGMELQLGTDIGSLLLYSVPFIMLVMFVKPFFVMFSTSYFGYGRKASFLTAIRLSQVSEFSLILVSQGLFVLNQISPEIFNITTIAAVVTITLSSYFQKYDKLIYTKVGSLLSHFDRLSKKKVKYEEIDEKPKKHIIVCGCHVVGHDIVEALKKMGKEYLVVDYNPEIIKSLINRGVPCIYGDIGDVDVLDKIGLKNSEVVISTASNVDDNLLMIDEVKRSNPKSVVIVRANRIDAVLELYNAGADYVIYPDMLVGDQMSKIIEKCLKDPKSIEDVKERHIFELEESMEKEVLDRYEPSFLRSIERKFKKKNSKK